MVIFLTHMESGKLKRIKIITLIKQIKYNINANIIFLVRFRATRHYPALKYVAPPAVTANLATLPPFVALGATGIVAIVVPNGY